MPGGHHDATRSIDLFDTRAIERITVADRIRATLKRQNAAAGTAPSRATFPARWTQLPPLTHGVLQCSRLHCSTATHWQDPGSLHCICSSLRSEERRVGKEC